MLVYKGNIIKLQRAVQEHQKRAQKAYGEVFGTKKARLLEQLAGDLLDERSFPDLVQSEGGTNHLAVGTLPYTDFRIDVDGSFRAGMICVTAFFKISEEGLKNSKTQPPYIGSFIHEFNHFAAFALARKPSIVYSSLLASECAGVHLGSTIEVMKYLKKIATETTAENRDDQARKVRLVCNAYMCWNVEEKIARLIDYLVFNKMGYRVDAPDWLGQKKKYGRISIAPPLAMIIQIPVGGDPFLELNKKPKDMVTDILEWQKYIRFGEPFATKALECYLECDIRKMKFSAIEKLDSI